MTFCDDGTPVIDVVHTERKQKCSDPSPRWDQDVSSDKSSWRMMIVGFNLDIWHVREEKKWVIVAGQL